MPELEKDLYEVAIIGSGPAGLTSAVYAARANLEPVIFEGIEPGGQLMTTTDVENYPGFAGGILGPELMAEMREQAARFGAELHFGKIEEVDTSEYPYTLTHEDGTTCKTKTIIISTGARARRLGLESEDELMGYGVTTCATCDGAFFKDQEVVVIGGGDSAMEEATFLTRHCSKVTIIHRRDELRASKIMADRAKRNDKIEWLWNTVVEEILGSREDGVHGVRVRDVETDEVYEFPCTGVFLAIGHIPNTDIFEGIVEMDEDGYIETQPGSTYTNVPGVFAVGDVQDHTYRQAVTAAGSGCMGAIDAERWLEAQEDEAALDAAE
jgi:thioredoxin reductase (NADPH)